MVQLAHYLQVVDALAPFVNEQRWGLRVGRLYPLRQQLPLVGLIPQVLVQVSIRDLFEGLDVVDGNEVRIQIHELDADFFEGTLRQQVTLDPRESLVGVVVGLGRISTIYEIKALGQTKYINYSDLGELLNDKMLPVR